MKHWWILFSLTLVSFAQLEPEIEEADNVLDDPAPWTEEDLKRLRSGELVTGHFLLGLPASAPRDFFPELPEEPEVLDALDISEEPEIDRSWISADTLLTYFRSKPKTELVDPQKLLSSQAFSDREAFLKYHRRDSDIPIYIYIFDGPQEVPVGYGADQQIKSQLSSEGQVLLAYYFLGKPEKSEVAMSPSLRDSLSLLEYRRVLDSAIAEAAEKSDPIDQLEGFAVQLSIRMYWVERALRASEAKSKPAFSEIISEESSEGASKQNDPIAKVRPYKHFFISGFLVILAIVLGWIGRKVSLKKSKYFFPEPDLPMRLHAPHAAGVGAVIYFRSPHVPPSAQREQVPTQSRKS